MTGHEYYFSWDANGNMTRFEKRRDQNMRYLCWDEEMRSIREHLKKREQGSEQNRLAAVKDDNYLNYYWYN
ncbi:MAG: hypothetical protein RQ866_06590 [Bacteroidales bacterium]|nr:hypothetical protein [Bacteroidales bacterium]